MANQPAPPPPDPGPPPAADPSPIVYASRPVAPGERVLAERFFERLADQSKQMDDLARQMITVELAVPGLYASILALLRGQDATLPAGWPVAVTFACWLAALAVTFLALFPRPYRVDPTVLRRDSAATDGPLGLEEFFALSAQRKRALLVIAAALFWLGIAAALWLLAAAPPGPPMPTTPPAPATPGP